MNLNFLMRPLVHLVFRTRQFGDKNLKAFAKHTRNKTILELGSGKKKSGEHAYSAKKFFHPSNTFIQSDINPKFGHKVVDITKVKDQNKYDVILCLNVLEHVYDFRTAVDNLYKAVKKGGTVVIFVPAFYPLHDEPYDYWRFTQHSLKKLLVKFRKVSIAHGGLRQYPYGYYAKAVK